MRSGGGAGEKRFCFRMAMRRYDSERCGRWDLRTGAAGFLTVPPDFMGALRARRDVVEEKSLEAFTDRADLVDVGSILEAVTARTPARAPRSELREYAIV